MFWIEFLVSLIWLCILFVYKLSDFSLLVR